jgi:hypothetical protein
MAVRISAAVRRLQGSVAYAESRPGTIGPINLEVKQTGERSAGNRHAAFDVAGAGNVARSRYFDTRRRKSETTENTNIDLSRRASAADGWCLGRVRSSADRSRIGAPQQLAKCAIRARCSRVELKAK